MGQFKIENHTESSLLIIGITIIIFIKYNILNKNNLESSADSITETADQSGSVSSSRASKGSKYKSDIIPVRSQR